MNQSASIMHVQKYKVHHVQHEQKTQQEKIKKQMMPVKLKNELTKDGNENKAKNKHQFTTMDKSVNESKFTSVRPWKFKYKAKNEKRSREREQVHIHEATKVEI